LITLSRGAAVPLWALLRAGAQTEAADEFGGTALNHASLEGHQGVVEQLLRAGAQTEAANERGNTALKFGSGRWKLGNYVGESPTAPDLPSVRRE